MQVFINISEIFVHFTHTPESEIYPSFKILNHEGLGIGIKNRKGVDIGGKLIASKDT